MIHTFVANPLQIPSIALSYAKQRELAVAYAEAYTSESGDSVTDYITRAAYDVYPGSLKNRGDRVSFKALLRSELRMRGKR